MKTKFEGFAELAELLRSLPAEVVSKSGGPLRAGLQKAAKFIADDASGNAARLPVSNIDDRDEYIRTGRLSKGIKVRRDPNPPQGVTERVVVKPRGVPYWHLVEFGTETMPARPYMRPAFEARKAEAVSVFRTELSKAIERAIKRGRKRGLIK